MAFASGKFTRCEECWTLFDRTESLETLRESFDERDLIFVGEQRCRRCGTRYLYTRRPETPEEVAMVKQKKRMAKAASRTDRKLTRPDRPKRPRQTDLPGTEDRAIKPLEEVAAAYAEVRDERMELNTREHELKVEALKLMKKFNKTIYRRNGVEIRIVAGEDDVKVRVQKPGEEEEPESEPEPAKDEAPEPEGEELRPGLLAEH